jgi:hypothetical protein
MSEITDEMLLIGAIRILGSILVLRWAFAGAVAAIATDFSDLFLKNLLDLGGVRNYQEFDKIMDQVYMAAFFVRTLGWEALPRNVGVGLYLFRLVGFVAFEVFGGRALLLLFPNVFEFWFVLIAAQRHWWPRYEWTAGRTLAWGLPLTALKETQEYVLHWAKLLDSFTAVEAVEAIWGWVTNPVR